MTARLVAVNVAHHVKPDPGNSSGLTGIDKRPVDGAVAVRTLGLVGDRVMDPEHHGGRDKAVYVYAREDQQRWAGELGRDLAPAASGRTSRPRASTSPAP